MNVRIQCPGCEKYLSLASQFQGKRIRCPVCKTIIPPHPEPLLDAADESVREGRHAAAARPASGREAERNDEEGPERRAPRRRRGTEQKSKRFSPLRVLIVAGIAGVCAVAAVVVIVFGIGVDFSNRTPPPQAHAPAEAPLPPPPKLDDMPDGPAPREMASETRRKVIRSTAYLKVTRAGNIVQQGSGFFAAEPGLVITNAHVVGMGTSGCSSPTSIDVVINSGESDETTLNARVLAADWINDLAVLRVNGDAGRCPPPLPVASRPTLSVTQKVFVLGFPFGSTLGKNITVSESSVSSLRKDRLGNIAQVQVNGGMHPGNSGGPVVDGRGMVVGVSVAILVGTQINFAVPAEKVHNLLRGSVQAVQFGEPYRDNDRVRLPVSLVCLDPLHRMQDLKVEVWTGKPGEARLASFQKPAPLADDGPREACRAEAGDGTKTVDVPLPALDASKVLWVQPVLTDAGGTSRWAAARFYKTSGLAPLERVPAALQPRFDTPERTLKVVSSSVYQTNQRVSGKRHVTAECLELAQQEGKAGELQVHFGPLQATYEVNGKSNPAPAEALNLFAGRLLRYMTDDAGTVEQRGQPLLDSRVTVPIRRTFGDLMNHLANSYEAGCLSLPNRLVQPLDTWSARLPIVTTADGRRQAVDLVVTCTYLGCRTVDGDKQAVIRLSGTAYGGVPYRSIGGSVTGNVHFSPEKGFITRFALKVIRELGSRGSLVDSSTFQVELTRAAGNKLALVPTQPADLKKGKTVFQTAGSLGNGDSRNLAARPGCFVKTFSVKLEADKTYVVEMNRPGVSLFDPYLILQDAAGMSLAEDDDGGGNQNARILYTPPASGTYQVCATTCDPGQAGTFELLVAEELGSATLGRLETLSMRVNDGKAP